MGNHTLANGFRNRVATQTVLIRRFYKEDDGVDHECQGTGVIIGHERISTFHGVHIATAGHVLDSFGTGQSVWEVSRVDKDEEGRCVERRQIFRDVGTWSSFPRIMKSKYLRDCDIGLIAIENRTSESPDEISSGSNELFIDPAKHPPLKVSPRTGYLQCGARVAWTGFPNFVSELTGTFDLCYFEGIVAATPSAMPIYLVDGHTASGVSGGPLWILADDGEPIIIGVCAKYTCEGEFPGLVVFCPMGVLLKYAEAFYSGKVQVGE
jgi:hypothetical protein